MTESYSFGKTPTQTHDPDCYYNGMPHEGSCFRVPHTTEVQTYADVAMWTAPKTLNDGELLKPRATLVYMTPDPLRVMAAASEMYSGKIARSPEEISQAQAVKWFTEMSRTKLHAPLEFIDLHFLFENVTRSFTHQLVRQRTAVYVQESLRFAVKEDATEAVRMPPTIENLALDDPRRMMWQRAVAQMGDTYNALVAAGVPAEDARGLLPNNITTRVHYKTNLRNLAEHAGMRLCTQAQYEWKEVWGEMIKAIMMYGPQRERWQQIAIGRLFKPVCYQTGKCEFMGDNDRWCRIRDRVQAHAASGDPSDTWSDIDPHEPLMEGAARMAPGEERLK
jgi:flavin-dependent thymidylate synthase